MHTVVRLQSDLMADCAPQTCLCDAAHLKQVVVLFHMLADIKDHAEKMC